MAKLKAVSSRQDPSVEYSVYIFHKPVHQNDNHITWEKRHTTANIHRAYRQAERLFNSQAYQRVEIKKKFFDPRVERYIDKTLKIFEEASSRPVGMWKRMTAQVKAFFPRMTWAVRGLKNRLMA